jgi:2-polyprenyl-6-methoxyphenol hydroxylase-like FAD-dependent oxidoreductase
MTSSSLEISISSVIRHDHPYADDLEGPRTDFGALNLLSRRAKILTTWQRPLKRGKSYSHTLHNQGKNLGQYYCLIMLGDRSLIFDSLSQDLMWPVDCIECIRSRPFSFSARSCNKWSLGRVILCGDAAHVFPPCRC